jgi:hypothetical protein
MDYQKLSEFINNNLEGLEKTPDKIYGFLKSKACDFMSFEDVLRASIAKGNKDKAVKEFLCTYFTLLYLQAALPAISPSHVRKFAYKSVPFLSILEKVSSYPVSRDTGDSDNSPRFTPSQE